MPGRPGSPPNAVTRSRDDSSSREPLGSGRCSPTRSPSSQCRRCSRWRGPTSRSPIRAGRGPSSGRPTTSSSNGPRSGNLPQQADELRAKVETIRAEGLGASSLTTAELRLLPLLPTHLSFREIGERLYVSRHTVKSQAISIYRKLGVSSRSETIDRMHELGLLEQS